ncbi:Rne/Rng family ribonuclease [candidate division WOR-3 bacterium]|nr:Rne/Rng family ribonuclease [candidate division WOR-3 bacterium]
MENGIFINSFDEELRVAVISNGRLLDIFIETFDRKKFVGDIYKGVITQVNTGLNAAFVDIAGEKSAFLPLSEVMSDSIDFEGEEPSEKRHLEKGQIIYLQITKSPMGKKGPRATTYISIPGKYCVMMPGRKIVGISRKIKNKDEKKRLRALGKDLITDDFGIIIRTEAQNRTKEDILSDLAVLKNKWREIEDISKKREAPTLLYTEDDPTIRILRDHLLISTEQLVIDNSSLFKKIQKYLTSTNKSGDLLKKIKLYNDKLPIFEYYGIEEEITKLFSPIVPLSSGAYVIFQHTEALVAIDVNSGKYSNINNPEDLAYRINLEAAREIAKQVRLRNLGGLIVIDFIDMQTEDHRRAVKAEIDKHMSGDKANYYTLPISELGLLQMTRKRTGPSVVQNLQKNCPFCKGSGLLFEDHYISSSLKRWLRNVSDKLSGKTIQIRLPRRLYEFISHQLSSFFVSLSKEKNISIETVFDPSAAGDQISVWCINDNVEISHWEGGLLPDIEVK